MWCQVNLFFAMSVMLRDAAIPPAALKQYRIIVKRRQVCGCLSQGWQYNFTSLLFPSQIAANLFRLATDSSPKAASVDTVWWCTQQQPLISYQPTNQPPNRPNRHSVSAHKPRAEGDLVWGNWINFGSRFVPTHTRWCSPIYAVSQFYKTLTPPSHQPCPPLSPSPAMSSIIYLYSIWRQPKLSSRFDNPATFHFVSAGGWWRSWWWWSIMNIWSGARETIRRCSSHPVLLHSFILLSAV